MAKERLQKIIAKAGILSRRAAEAAIQEGRVQVNGQPVGEMGVQADPETDVIEIDGKKISLPTTKKTFLFYKPRNVITSKQDEKGRLTVMDFFKDHPEVNPVGRLDYESEGLLLMTTDGDLLYELTHPKFEIEKEYWIQTSTPLNTTQIGALLSGIELDDGLGKFDFVSESEGGYLIRIHEGRNRFIRRMIDAAAGVEIQVLKRLRVGPYTIGTLKPGQRVEIKIKKT